MQDERETKRRPEEAFAIPDGSSVVAVPCVIHAVVAKGLFMFRIARGGGKQTERLTVKNQECSWLCPGSGICEFVDRDQKRGG